jgi:hypothetical protein
VNEVTIHQVHQIEYRWHPDYDLSPVASSMPREPTMRWDSQIRNWVRHPGADGPAESVRYQIVQGGLAALAWRYRDIKVTEADGRAQSRPLGSRVLVGAARTLSPEMAVILCRSGLPAAAGPRPGETEPPPALPVISAADLAAIAEATVDGLDHEAAWQDDLQPVLAAAFADPDTPLAVGIGEPQILQPPAQGVQALLLWGLWRIGYPLLGARRRRWSFSTFEPPLRYVDPKSLPDIVFRSAQEAQSAPTSMPRRELKVFPGTASGSTAGTIYDELAAWLAAEYRELGGDELQRRIADVTDGAPDDSRLLVAYDRLSVRWAPGPDKPAEAEAEAEAIETGSPGPREFLPEESEQPASVPDPESTGNQQQEEKPADEGSDLAPFPMAELIGRLASAGDAREFASLLGEAIAASLPPDEADRRRARETFGDSNCLVPVFRRHRYAPDEYALARIVCLIVIPDLGQPQVRDEIADWAGRGESAVVAALLSAARYCGADVLNVMREILRPVLAELWLTDRSLLGYWSPSPASPPDAASWRGTTVLRPRGQPA